MGKSTKYEAKVPGADGRIPYTADEHQIWHELITRQQPLVERYCAPEFLTALERMRFPTDRIPQPDETSKVLFEATGWQVAPVPALINFDRFFQLLSEKRFPAASFIRSREEMEYLQEPDIFHEIYGHTPLLTDPRFAEFTHAYGQIGLAASKEDRVMLARLYWFTVEFGLMRQKDGSHKAYGAGLASSIGELPYSVDSPKPQRRPFDPLDMLRTPYRIDIFQTVYFCIDSLDDMFRMAHMPLIDLIRQARALGMHEPTYPPADKPVKWA